MTTKTYIDGDDPSNSFFGSVATTNYNGDTRGVGLSITCTISGGKVDNITWDKNEAIEGYDDAPILHFVPVDQNGGGARAEVIVVAGRVIDIVLTDGGSGYTKAPKVVVARQYEVCKGNRKFDPFVELRLNNKITQASPVYIQSEWSYSKGIGGSGGAGYAIVSAVLAPVSMPAVKDKITIFFDPITRSVTTKALLGSVKIVWPTTQANAGTNLVTSFKEITYIEPSISVGLGVTAEIGKETVYQVGFVDYRHYNPAWNSSAPTHLNNMTLRPSFLMWENAKFMDTGNIVDGSGVAVSALTIDEMARWGYDLEDFADNAGSGISDAGYAFNVGYPSINYYMGRINQNLVAGDVIVYAASTSDFPATGTLQLGSEQITYTGKQSDRFTGCTRCANGKTAIAHTACDYFRSA